MQMKAVEVGSVVEHFTQRGMRKNINNETEKKGIEIRKGKKVRECNKKVTGNVQE